MMVQMSVASLLFPATKALQLCNRKYRTLLPNVRLNNLHTTPAIAVITCFCAAIFKLNPALGILFAIINGESR